MMRDNAEGRLAYRLIEEFFSTGVVPRALGQLWIAADLNPLSDDCCSDLLGLAVTSDDVGDLFDPAVDPPDEVEGDDDYGNSRR